MNSKLLPILFAVVASAAFAKDDGPMVVASDVQMRAAVARAQGGLDAFFAERAKSDGSARDFRLRVALQDGAVSEALWVAPFRPAAGGFEGKLKDEPRQIKLLYAGKEVQFRRDQIVDWSYLKGGRLHGNYTTCVVLGRMNRAAAQAEADARALKCDW